MNCKSFTDVNEWERILRNIFAKHTENRPPSLIILLGQEAWATFLSLPEAYKPQCPIIVSMVSRNFIYLPKDNEQTQTWHPRSCDFFEEETKLDNIITGYMHDYDIDQNIELILDFYPDTENIVFLSDNTYGGVSLQSLMVKKMQNHPDLNLILIDGRQHTIYTLVDLLKDIPQKSVLMVGTWRVDMNDGYFMPNATYLIMEANPDLPAFTPTSVALGHWTIGGVIPAYRHLGYEMAIEAYNILDCDSLFQSHIHLIENHLVLDYNKINKKGLDPTTLNKPYTIVNKPPTFYELYHQQIWWVLVIIISLTVALIFVLYYYYRMKILNKRLAISEVNLLEAKNAAEESNHLKSAFLANMSHEIRTPLNAIVGFTDVIASGEVPADEVMEYNTIIKSNSDLLLRLINDILDMSRLESGKVILNYEKCDVVDLCREALATVDISTKTGNQFKFDCHLEHFLLDIDPQRLKQVIINLLSNASKFTNHGIITLAFWIDEVAQEACFSVTDTGCGIPAEKQNHVFQRFEKLNEYAQGTGLGLAICKLIVEKGGGRIWVDPAYTTGARFVFTIPINSSPQ